VRAAFGAQPDQSPPAAFDEFGITVGDAELNATHRADG
jgi:hypothetical protein